MKRRHGLLVLLGVLVSAAPAQGAGRESKASSLARDRSAAVGALRQAQALRAGRGVVTGRELTPALAQLSAAYAALDPRDRRAADRLLARPSDGGGDPQGDGYTVPEHAPYCTVNFCIHWVTSTDDAPDLTDSDADGVPDYVEQMAAEFEFVRSREVGDMGWHAPISDGAAGGDGRLDVYLVELAGTGILGYAATDPGQADPHEKFAYMVMDDDYAGETVPLDVLRVTAAHEYNHVLQFAYDAQQDTWMFEATAVWMEDVVWDAVDHYLGFIPTWATLDEIPLARNFRDKHYGSAVWNMWLDARDGPALIRSAWAGSRATAPASFAPAAYDAALTAGGHEGFSATFARFSAAVAEWRTASEFPEGAAYADGQRRGNLAVGGVAVSPVLDHTTYAMYTVPQPAGGWPAVLRLDGELPAGVFGALALVGRTGADQLAGTVTTQLQLLPDGGAGSIQLEDPASFGRITAVLVNADAVPTGFVNGEWTFAADAKPFTAAAGASSAVAAAPANTAPPGLSGTPRDGSVLSSSNGAWSGSAPMAYARQWLRCDDDTLASCSAIASATGATYTATESDVGKRLRVRVTATNGVSGASAESAPTIAVVALAPANQTAPAIDDLTPIVGQTINASEGTWSGSKPLTLTYQWRRCTTTGLPSCADIAAATASAYTVAPDDADRFLRVRVTAANSAGSATRDSGVTQKVVAPPPDPPSNTTLPSIAGTPRDGETLTASDGVWTGTPTFKRQWLLCDDAGASCAAIAGETGAELVLGPDDVGHTVVVRVTATNGGGTVDATSDPTAVVVAVAPSNAVAPAITGTARDGELLTAVNGVWNGTAPAVTRVWRRCDGATCADLGEPGPTYLLTADDVGHTLLVRETAVNSAGTVTADSDPTAVVAAVAPSNATPPAVTGEARQGAALISTAGTWNGTIPITLTRHWQRCPSGVLTCADIPGAVGESYTLGLADVLAEIRVVVAATNVGGGTSAASALVGPVAAASTGGDGGGGGVGGGTSGGGAGGGAGGGGGAPPPAALAATFKAPTQGKLAKALAGKLAVQVDCSAACALASRLELARSAARKLKLPAVIAAGKASLTGPGRATVRLRFTAKARKRLAKARTLTATLVTQARDATGALAAQRKTKLSLKR